MLMQRDDEAAQIRYATALATWASLQTPADDAEILWDACCVTALGVPYESCR